MLAKEIKIKTLKRQREFIKRQLDVIDVNKGDGDTSYSYIGHIYPEVREYFENEGFAVKEVKSDMLTMASKGLPIYLFTVKDDVRLDEEELKAAEAIEIKEDATKSNVDELLTMVMESMACQH